jgi:dTDP-4-dehydrorhamnose reductase
MILLLGASGYLGQAFATELTRRNLPFTAASRASLNYADFGILLNFLRANPIDFVVNCAGYTGKPNVDACEDARAETLQGNTLLPQTIVHACAAVGVLWGHVSSGCIYTGAKITGADGQRVERDLTAPAFRALMASHRGSIHGFTEDDEPNFTFRRPPCSFYSGTKALAEEAIAGIGEGYIWRLRIPFDEFDNARNYLSKVQRYSRVYENVNSLSHRGDFAAACLDLWESRAPLGAYNVTNPGFVATRPVIEMIQRILKPHRNFEFWANDEEFYKLAAKTPRSNCILDVSKLLAAGVKIRPVEEALEASLRAWKPEPLHHS